MVFVWLVVNHEALFSVNVPGLGEKKKKKRLQRGFERPPAAAEVRPALRTSEKVLDKAQLSPFFPFLCLVLQAAAGGESRSPDLQLLAPVAKCLRRLAGWGPNHKPRLRVVSRVGRVEAGPAAAHAACLACLFFSQSRPGVRIKIGRRKLKNLDYPP